MFSPLALRGPFRLKSIFVLILLIAANSFLFAGSKRFDTTIKNFGQINKNYYRGGQPNESQFAELKRMGVKTVIDLQKDGKDEEAAWVKNAGMQFFKIRLKSTRPATPEQAEYFLRLVNDPANWPVYVHCAAGKHRTGAMTAIYRITQDSWTADAAFKEMNDYGYYSFPNHGSLKTYVYKYFDNHQSAAKAKEAMRETKEEAAVDPVQAPLPAPESTPTVMIDAN